MTVRAERPDRDFGLAAVGTRRIDPCWVRPVPDMYRDGAESTLIISSGGSALAELVRESDQVREEGLSVRCRSL